MQIFLILFFLLHWQPDCWATKTTIFLPRNDELKIGMLRTPTLPLEAIEKNDVTVLHFNVPYMPKWFARPPKVKGPLHVLVERNNISLEYSALFVMDSNEHRFDVPQRSQFMITAHVADSHQWRLSKKWCFSSFRKRKCLVTERMLVSDNRNTDNSLSDEGSFTEESFVLQRGCWRRNNAPF